MRSATFLRVTIPAALLLAVACHPSGGDPAGGDGRSAALEPRPVELVRPELRHERPVLELVGEVRPFDTIAVPAEVSGRVDHMFVKVGDAVRTGQPLAEIDRETYRLRRDAAAADLAAARAELALAAKELERKRDLLSDHTVSQAVFDQAQSAHDLAAARVAAASAALDLAERNLAKSVVRSPADGAVAERHRADGEWADVGDALVALATTGAVKVAAAVPEAWADRLAGLTTFEFAVQGASGRRTAKIYSIDPVVQGSSRSFEVVGTAPAAAEVRPGMFATVFLTSPTEVASLWLPASAVAASDMPEVMLVQDGAVAVAKVQIGRRDDGAVEVLGGVDAETAVIRDVAGLQRGLSVTVTGGAEG